MDQRIGVGGVTNAMLVMWVVVALSLATAHWFEWPRRLPRLLAYMIGTVCINVPLSVWMVIEGYGRALLVAQWGAITIAGLVVIGGWGYDTLLNDRRRRKIAEKALDDEQGSK